MWKSEKSPMCAARGVRAVASLTHMCIVYTSSYDMDSPQRAAHTHTHQDMNNWDINLLLLYFMAKDITTYYKVDYLSWPLD